jgi:glycosyltransferase involved in cell wall biosynthesis
MVIAVFIRQLSLGGAEKQSLLLTRELQKSFSTLLVVWTDKIIAPEYQKFIEENNLSIVFLQGSPVGKILKFFNLMKNKRVTHLFNFLLINNFVGGIAGRLAGVKQIFGGIRNCDIVPSKFRWQKFLHNYISHETIFNNYVGAENLSLRGFRKDKMVVIHNGIDVDGLPQKERGEEWPVILTASRFLPQKDHYTALRAIEELVQRGRKFTYVLAGYGDREEEIRQWIQQLKLQNYVHLLVAPQDLPQLFNHASVYLSTSLREGLSNSLMEAMAAGLPVVATNVGDNKYLIDDGENGFLTDVGDFTALADGLSRLLGDEDLRRAMGKKGNEKIKNGFSSRFFLDNYMELIGRSIC